MGKHGLVVASVPAAHAYVTNLGLADAGIELLADPPVPGAPPGRWWPPQMLDAGWIAAHAAEFALLHVHFGMESLTLAELRAALDALHAAGRPLVHTVHDLSHPQLADDAHHQAQLELVVAAADALITLTPGAADEIATRYRRRATVIAHPAMRTDPRPPVAAAGAPRAGGVSRAGAPGAEGAPRATRAPRATGAPRVGVHLRDLRPGIDGPGTVATLDAALVRVREAGTAVTGCVWMHDRVRDPAAAATVRATCARSASLELIEADRPDDATLEAELAGLAVSVVPYRHGTHSGWVELCWDLGVPVAVPDVGHVAEQHPDPGFRRVFTPGSDDSLATALLALLAVPEAVPEALPEAVPEALPATAPEAVPGASARALTRRRRAAARARQRPGLAAAHLDVYRAAIRARSAG